VWRGEEPARELAPFVETPTEVVDRMLELAGVTEGDVVYDVGSGDGRIVLAAARKYGARGVGIELDARLVALARAHARLEGLDRLVTFIHQDALSVDLSPATVVTLYLGNEANLLFRPKLWRELRPGSRVVSHQYHMGDWRPARVVRVQPLLGPERTLYLWRIEGQPGAPR
jgi:SAM-dependent methyltransferase